MNNITLDVQQGEMIAIDGSKGSGKTTLLQLMSGFLTPSKGDVHVNGVNPSVYNGYAHSRLVGYLPQQVAIFKGTILENLTEFQDGEAMIARAYEAADMLGLGDVINQLPKGFQTQLQGSPSDPIPPGVKQRIALARVLARKPHILLFDDADRTLDKEGYNRLFRYIGKMKGKITFVLVSHDLNLLSFADRHYYLHEGVLREQNKKPSYQITNLVKIFEREAV